MGESYRLGARRLDVDRSCLLHGDRPVALQPRAYDVLLALARARGRVLSRAALLRAAWSGSTVVDDALTQAIRKARAAIGDDPTHPTRLLTVARKGYRLVVDPDGPATFGRDELVATIEQALVEDRGVALIGPGGIGKTQIARTLGGVWVDAGACGSDEALLRAIADALGVGGVLGRERVTAALAARGPLRVVIDEVEPVAAAAAELATALHAACPELQLVWTRRSRLGRGREVAVGPLGSEAAFALFLDRAGDGVRAEDHPAARALVDRLGGHPLAIALAAAQLRVVPPGALSPEERLGWTLGDRDLRSCVDASWRRLSSVDRAALVALAPFAGAFPGALAREVAGDAGPVARLVDAALVEALPDRRFRLHDEVRAFARQQPGSDAAADRVARAVVEAAEAALAAGAPVTPWLPDLEAAVARAEPVLATRAAVAAWTAWESRSPTLAIELTARLVAGALPAASRAVLLRIRAVAWLGRDRAAASAALAEAEVLAAADPVERARIALVAGHVALFSGDAAQALIRASAAAGAPDARVAGRGRLLAARALADLDRPDEALAEAVAGLDTTHDRPTRAALASLLGTLHADAGRVDDALAAEEDALREADSPLLSAGVGARRAALLLRVGRVDEAAEALRALDAVFRLHGDLQGDAVVRSGLGLVHLLRGELGAAEEELSRAAAVSARIGRRDAEARVLAHLAAARLRRGRVREAAATLERVAPQALDAATTALVAALRAKLGPIPGAVPDLDSLSLAILGGPPPSARPAPRHDPASDSA